MLLVQMKIKCVLARNEPRSERLHSNIYKCALCANHPRDQAEKPLITRMITHDLPMTWSKIELFELNQREYLITVDYYSSFFEIDRLKNKTSNEIYISKLKQHLARHGPPTTLISDSGQPFNSPFESICRSCYKIHGFDSMSPALQAYWVSLDQMEKSKMLSRLPSPRGGERKVTESSSDQYLALLYWRNTQTDQGLHSSPAQHLFSRRTTTTTLLKPEANKRHLIGEDERAQSQTGALLQCSGLRATIVADRIRGPPDDWCCQNKTTTHCKA